MEQQAQALDVNREVEVNVDDYEDIQQQTQPQQRSSIPDIDEEWKQIHQKHLIESLQAYQYLNDVKPPQEPLQLADSDRFTKPDDRKLLVFDMDETLIHCIIDYDENTVSDVKIPVQGSTDIHYKYVNLRPYVIEVLLELSSLYYIVLFTASTQDYADPILNYLEKDHKLLQHRFYRNH